MTTEPTDDITEEETALPQSDSAGETDTPDSDSAEHSDDESPNAEAARYTTRLREAEATVAALTETVTALQRQLVEGQCVASAVFC